MSKRDNTVRKNFAILAKSLNIQCKFSDSLTQLFSDLYLNKIVFSAWESYAWTLLDQINENFHEIRNGQMFGCR